jgi:hypothetical protein
MKGRKKSSGKESTTQGSFIPPLRKQTSQSFREQAIRVWNFDDKDQNMPISWSGKNDCINSL